MLAQVANPTGKSSASLTLHSELIISFNLTKVKETKKPPWVGGVAYPRFEGHQPLKEVFGYWLYSIRCGRYCQMKSKKDPRQIDTPCCAC